MGSEVCRELLALALVLEGALEGGALYGPSVPEAAGAWNCTPPPPCPCCVGAANDCPGKYDPPVCDGAPL